MFKGFYNLTSGMLSQGRRLDVVANNMTNISTPGYKSDHYTDSTFDEALYVRIGNKNRLSDAEMGEINHILAPSQLYTDLRGDGAFPGLCHPGGGLLRHSGRGRRRVLHPVRQLHSGQ